MKLTVEKIRVKDIEFSKETLFKDGILYINKEDILEFLKEENCFESLKIDIVKPGDSARIINVVDVVQPRCKIGTGIDWPGVLSDEYEITGGGTTRALENVGIVLCQNNTYWSRKWGSFDMSGACSSFTPYAQMPEIIIEPIAIENCDFKDYREAVRRIGFKTGLMLAKATLNIESSEKEIFDNETQYRNLPSIAYVYQVYSKQYDTANYREPMFYGNAIPDNLPIIMSPTEILDGAISPCGGFRCVTTYEIQNHAVIVELMRRHGKDLNFVGVIVTVTSVETRHRSLVSKMVASTLKEVFKADGIIVTKGVGGASTLCIGAISSEAEKLGIKAVPIIQILNSSSNLSTECLINEQNVDSIVQSGTYYHNYELPPVEKLYGSDDNALFMGGNDGVIGGHKIASGVPAKGKVVSYSMKHVGMMSQIGASYDTAVDY